MNTAPPHSQRNSDRRYWLVIGVSAFILYMATLLRGVGGGDTAEFQRVAPTLGLAHSTGYPFYTLLGWVWSHIIPFGTMAWRMNLFSACAAAATCSVLFVICRQLQVNRIVAVGTAILMAVGLAFWQQATHAEIYALAALLEVLLIAGLLAWRAKRLPLWVVGGVVGLMLAHHRTAVLLLPFAGIFVLLQRPRWRDCGLAVVAMLLPLGLYAYVPLRAAPWQDRSQLLREYLLGSVGGEWFSLTRLWHDGWQRPWELLQHFIAPQYTWLGMGLAVYGGWRLWRSDRAFAIFVVGSYGLNVVFCAAYYVDDIDTFLIPAHVLQAVLIAVGVMAIAGHQWLKYTLIAGLIGMSVWQHLPVVWRGNSDAAETIARTRLAQPLAANSVVIGDGWSIESLRYLQAVERLRPDLEFGFNADASYIRNQLERGRSVYLLNATPQLGLRHQRVAGMWQIDNAPLSVSRSSDLRWQDNIILSGYDLPTDAFRAGDPVLMTLRWQAQVAPQRDYMRFVHIVDQQGTIWGQDDSQPSANASSSWQPNTAYFDVAAPTLKSDTPAGTYRVVVGLYDGSGQRLPRVDGTDVVELGEITVR